MNKNICIVALCCVIAWLTAGCATQVSPGSSGKEHAIFDVSISVPEDMDIAERANSITIQAKDASGTVREDAALMLTCLTSDSTIDMTSEAYVNQADVDLIKMYSQEFTSPFSDIEMQAAKIEQQGEVFLVHLAYEGTDSQGMRHYREDRVFVYKNRQYTVRFGWLTNCPKEAVDQIQSVYNTLTFR